MKFFTVPLALTSAMCLLFGVIANPVLAQSPATKSGDKSQQHLSDIKAKGDAEITQRISSLNALLTKLQAMKRLSDTDKTAFASQIQSQITGLNGQKAKLDADTDVTTARADRQAIFTQFRIYMLFIPKTHILAAADAMGDAADAFTAVIGKLQARITQAQQAGKDVSALQAALTDMQNKVADAKTHYQNAENTVMPLTPDQGDKGKIQANISALQSAHGMIKAGAQDLKAARADAETIRKGLRQLGSSGLGTASSSAHQ